MSNTNPMREDSGITKRRKDNDDQNGNKAPDTNPSGKDTNPSGEKVYYCVGKSIDGVCFLNDWQIIIRKALTHAITEKGNRGIETICNGLDEKGRKSQYKLLRSPLHCGLTAVLNAVENYVGGKQSLVVTVEFDQLCKTLFNTLFNELIEELQKNGQECKDSDKIESGFVTKIKATFVIADTVCIPNILSYLRRFANSKFVLFRRSLCTRCAL